MKAHLTKVSLALLSTVFLLGCQDMGSEPVGPDGPQFNKPTDEGKHDHGGDEEGRQVFTVQVDGDKISGGPRTNDNNPCVGCNNLIVDPFKLNFDKVFFGQLSCEIPIPESTEGVLFFGTGDDHVHVLFQFSLNGAEHILGLLATRPDDWPPVVGADVTLTPMGQAWEISSKGRNHQNACTGQGPDIGKFSVRIIYVRTT